MENKKYTPFRVGLVIVFVLGLIVAWAKDSNGGISSSAKEEVGEGTLWVEGQKRRLSQMFVDGPYHHAGLNKRGTEIRLRGTSFENGEGLEYEASLFLVGADADRFEGLFPYGKGDGELGVGYVLIGQNCLDNGVEELYYSMDYKSNAVVGKSGESVSVQFRVADSYVGTVTGSFTGRPLPIDAYYDR